jgi:hypothetical protein
VFLVNSRHPLLCATPHWLPNERSPFSRSYGGILPSSFNIVLSSALVCSTCPPVSVWGTVLSAGLFPGTPRPHAQSIKRTQLPVFVTTARLRNINLIPIDYGFRPRLRGRLTLSGLTLLRNPWAFGESVSHTLCRYSCQHSHFRYLQRPSQDAFTGLRNAPLPRITKTSPGDTPSASVCGLSPGTSSAQAGLSRPVSYYAFFKGWLLLSQPPGCLGLPTSFPT